jgi:hypothetical protein
VGDQHVDPVLLGPVAGQQPQLALGPGRLADPGELAAEPLDDLPDPLLEPAPGRLDPLQLLVQLALAPLGELVGLLDGLGRAATLLGRQSPGAKLTQSR